MDWLFNLNLVESPCKKTLKKLKKFYTYSLCLECVSCWDDLDGMILDIEETLLLFYAQKRLLLYEQVKKFGTMDWWCKKEERRFGLAGLGSQ